MNSSSKLLTNLISLCFCLNYKLAMMFLSTSLAAVATTYLLGVLLCCRCRRGGSRWWRERWQRGGVGWSEWKKGDEEVGDSGNEFGVGVSGGEEGGEIGGVVAMVDMADEWMVVGRDWMISICCCQDVVVRADSICVRWGREGTVRVSLLFKLG